MTRDQIITELHASHLVENYAAKFMGAADAQYRDDIVGELYMMICELPVKMVEDMVSRCGMRCFRSYVSGIIVRQMRSDHSRVYRRYTLHVYRERPTADLTEERGWESED